MQSKNYTYSDSDTGLQFTFTLSGSASYNNVNNYLKISTSTDEDTKPKLTITSTSNIQFDVTSGGNAGYLDTDPLTSIGYNGNGTIAVTPDDSKLKSFTIKFNNVSVTSTPGGSFTVTITDIAGSTETTVNDSSDLTRVLGD